ncbi:MAG TPA: hypothetical protein VL443_08310 [Cyclobacteriaceae bacterium]|jgi:hypothetical protein|nr:hypothetical protein [Cyclobacteriaceae bacterium]
MAAFDDSNNIYIPDPSDPIVADQFRSKWGWDAHEQAIIRGTYTAGDMESVSNAAVTSNKDGKISYQAGSARTKLLERMIIDWTFTRNGQKIPVTPASIKRLPHNYTTPLLEKCDELASTLTEDEQEDFFDSVKEPFLESSPKENQLLNLL